MKSMKLHAGKVEIAKRMWKKPAPIKYPVDTWRWARFLDARVVLQAVRTA